MQVILIGVLMFLCIILLLIIVLLLAKKKLVPQGDVTIRINDDSKENQIKTRAGATLLGTLSSHKIFIASACGGKGS